MKSFKIGDLTVKLPIIQGGMGVGVSLSGLASAVANEGGGIVGVNVMVALSNFSDMVRTAISEKADIIFSGAGLPLDLPSYLREDSTTKLVPIVSSARAARVICEKWKANYDYLPDALVVEGPKAGGHLGYKREQIDNADYSLERIVPEVVSEVGRYEELYGRRIPVIAAGGSRAISTSAMLAAMEKRGESMLGQCCTIFFPSSLHCWR